jgi:hypothetical protein
MVWRVGPSAEFRKTPLYLEPKVLGGAEDDSYAVLSMRTRSLPSPDMADCGFINVRLHKSNA